MDPITHQFNLDIVIQLKEETIQLLHAAIKQYQLIENRLNGMNIRLERAKKNGRLLASLEMQRDTTEGVLCMYEEYIKRQVTKLYQLQKTNL